MTMCLPKVLVTLAISYLLASTPTNGEVKQKLFSKIIGNQVSWPNQKVVTLVHKPTSVKMACYLECLRTAECELVCFSQDGLSCYLFNYFVSVHWEGNPSGPIFSSCYTSWGRPDNVIRPNMVTSSSAFYSYSYNSSALINGYATRYCCKSCFLSSNQSNSYWQVDLGAPVRVKSVTVVTNDIWDFSNVDIRLGNSSDHLSNPVFAFVASGPQQDTMTITGEVYAGRYLALSHQNWGYLAACELQVHKG